MLSYSLRYYIFKKCEQGLNLGLLLGNRLFFNDSRILGTV